MTSKIEKPVFVSRRAEQQWSRMQAVKLYRNGMSAAEIAGLFDVTPRAVFQWVAAFWSGGQNALVAKPASGRPPKLSAEHMQRLACLIGEHTPNQLRFEFGLWTLRLIGALVEREFQIRLSLPTLGKLMHQLGFTPQRPLHRAWEQDQAWVQRWYDEQLPAIRAQAKAKGALLMFADEASIRSDHHSGTTWAPMGQTPIVRVTGQRVSVQMLSAVGPQGQLEFMLHEGRVTAEVFIAFLRQLMLSHAQPLIVVVDNSAVHTAAAVRQFVQATSGHLELKFLPPYSPQLNPDEQVWKSVKAHVSKQLPANKFEFRVAVRLALERLQGMTAVVKGLFSHPECGFVK